MINGGHCFVELAQQSFAFRPAKMKAAELCHGPECSAIEARLFIFRRHRTSDLLLMWVEVDLTLALTICIRAVSAGKPMASLPFFSGAASHSVENGYRCLWLMLGVSKILRRSIQLLRSPWGSFPRRVELGFLRLDTERLSLIAGECSIFLKPVDESLLRSCDHPPLQRTRHVGTNQLRQLDIEVAILPDHLTHPLSPSTLACVLKKASLVFLASLGVFCGFSLNLSSKASLAWFREKAQCCFDFFSLAFLDPALLYHLSCYNDNM